MDDRHGFSFLPSAATIVAGTVAAPRFPLTAATSQKNGATLGGIGVGEKEALRTWVHRTWLRQLATWRGMTGEVVNAVAEAYPTPRALYNALRSVSDSSFFFVMRFIQPVGNLKTVLGEIVRQFLLSPTLSLVSCVRGYI